ncbi:hypothetical protein GOP47_0020794 [Adiantum capillus-veneris]|uniref:Tubulin-specific chaperone D n=1 Tax=Adiantum capillus-veneris TaxID=13818 RepID=A0A9D4UBF2_ADICA|nr:hypothetical protein GOP47_0020794 [Adiantum capillus-veneris]
MDAEAAEAEELRRQLANAEPDECSVALKRSFVLEWKVLEALISAMVSGDGDVPMPEIKKAQLIMEKYQEQGQLLEPYLESMVCPLMEILRKQASANTGNPSLGTMKKICSVIYTLVTVCGYKTVIKFFPHHVSDLEPAVELLQSCHSEIEETSILREESTGQWETKCCLLLWLSILVLVPFDIASVDSSFTEIDLTVSRVVPPLVGKILTLCKDYLASPGPMREMAGVLLSRLLTRPDMPTALRDFMTWTQQALAAALENSAGVFLAPGVMGAVAAIFKAGDRDILYPVTPTAWEEASQLSKSSLATQSLLLRKFLVKLVQRIGLVYLPPRTISWQYKAADSVIMQNLSSTSHQDLPFGSSSTTGLSHIAGNANERGVNSNSQAVEDDDVDMVNEVEDIIGHLLTSLKDKDTVVRWSAAKGVGRITGRLTLGLADEIVASVLELLSPTQGDGAWHGGCLALAELARRGLLIPSRLAEVVPLIVNALHYDVRRGSHSIGAHVRDAAAYVCWAFARAYSPSIMKGHLIKLAPALLTVACYDREVNCRRAASAAFQENIGRQGGYPHGIDLVNAADYFSLASRPNAYCTVAVYVAQFQEYRLPMITELLDTKICHWERGLRELSAKALSLLVRYDMDFFGSEVLDKLLSWILSADLNLRHGATLASAEVILSLKNIGFICSQEKERALADIVPAIEKARLYRGKGGEIMRAAVSRFIECEALIQIPLTTNAQKKTILDTISENLRHPNGQIQDCAVAALKAFIRGYMVPAKSVNIERVTLKHLQILQKDENPAARRGSALAFTALPHSFLLPHWKEIVATLGKAIHLQENLDERDAETRVNAVRALVAVCKSLYDAGSEVWISSLDSGKSPLSVLKGQVMESLFEALDDYAVDNRGDVGSWVREAAIEGLKQCTELLCSAMGPSKESMRQKGEDDLTWFDHALTVRLVGGLIKQALEKINRVRDVAGRTLQNILHNKLVDIPCIPHKEALKILIPEDNTINWGAPDDVFPRLVPVLQFPVYRMHAMSGLVISIGGLGDSLGKVSLSCLLDFLQGEHASLGLCIKDTDNLLQDNSINDLTWLGKVLTSITETYASNDRVIVPTYKSIDLLYSKRVFPDTQAMDHDCALRILASVKEELHGSKDIVKIMAGINVLSHLASMMGSVGMESISQMLKLLGHRYPKVRKTCAEQLYILLLQKGEEFLKPDELERAEDLVSETVWDAPVDRIKDEREQLALLFKIQKEDIAVRASKIPQGWPLNSAAHDENASYAALLNELR